MSTVYLGTSDFAATVLRILAASKHRPALVVTRPDRRRGRGRRLAAPPVADAARELGLDLVQPDDVNDDEARARISAAAPSAVCVCAFGALIREPLLSEHELLNVHPSLLPRWRGAAPVERAIEAGDEETGVAIISLVAELDAGPVHLMRPEPIRADDTFGTLAPRLAELGGELLVEVLDERPEPRPQAPDGMTYAEKIEAADRVLDPALPAAALARRVRALTPHIGAHVALGGDERLRVSRAQPDPTAPAPEPGELAAADGRLLLGAADGALELLEVQPAGGRPMEAASWLRGHGDRLARNNEPDGGG